MKINLSNSTVEALFSYVKSQTPNEVVALAEEKGMRFAELEKAFDELYHVLKEGKEAKGKRKFGVRVSFNGEYIQSKTYATEEGREKGIRATRGMIGGEKYSFEKYNV